MATSLLKTLAGKGRTTGVQTHKRWQSMTQTPNGPRKCLQLTIPRAGKNALVATFGGLPLHRKPTAIKDQVLDAIHTQKVRNSRKATQQHLRSRWEQGAYPHAPCTTSGRPAQERT